MQLAILPKNRNLVYYLAAEEYFAGKGFRGDGVVLVWNVAPTVIIGRHQVMEKEVNLEYCKQMGVKVFRRRSGGGCVYSDRGNLMISCISPKSDSHEVFSDFLNSLGRVLESLGLETEISGRNDLLAFGKKISGSAYYKTPSGRSIIHGTLLYDSDLEALERCITPSRAKIVSKGVDSVRSRVCNIREFLPNLSITELADKIGKGMSNAVCRIEEDELRIIESIENEYYDPAFLYGNDPAFDFYAGGRIEGIGELSLSLKLSGAVVVEAALKGDWFDKREGVDEYLCDILRGLRLEQVTEALRKASKLGEFVNGLDSNGLDGDMLATMLEATLQTNPN